MLAHARYVLELQRDPGRAARLAGASTVVLLATLMGHMVAYRSPYVRDLLAVLLLATLVILGLRLPQAAMLATFAFLPFVELTRRWLIPYGGWQSHDPLLLVGPAVAVVLALHHRSSRRDGGLSRMMALLLFIVVCESLNPLGGSILAGLVGLLFVGAPLVWFFVGRELLNRRAAISLLAIVITSSVGISLYGFAQSEGHLTSWDSAWVSNVGFASLNVGGRIRAFGTFASPTEYATFLAIAIVICLALALHGHVYLLALVPLLGTALFLEGSRGTFVLVICTSIALIGLRTKRIVIAVVTIALTLGLVAAAWHRIGGWANTQGQQSANPVIQHQIGGLAHPLDAKQSTLPTHWHEFVYGFTGIGSRPLGLGTGATNIASSSFGGVAAGTEVDISNMFVALGIAGGILYVLVVFTALRHGFAVYHAQGDLVGLATLGVLLVCLGQWSNGGFYAVSPLVWLLVGQIERSWKEGRLGQARVSSRIRAAPPALGHASYD